MDIGREGAFKFKPRREKLNVNDTINGTPLLDMISLLGAYRHTHGEAAALLGVGESTFRRFLGDNEEARDAWKDGRQLCKASVRRLIFLHAKGDAPTARFLAKNILKMTDSGDDAPPPPPVDNSGRLSRLEAVKRIVELQKITIIEAQPAQSGSVKKPGRAVARS